MKKLAEERTSVTLLSHGLKVFGVLHMPEGSKQVPAVLFCHGFGGNKSGKFRLSVRQSEMLSERGIASLRIDFRGSGDSEGDFADTTIQTQVEDAHLAFRYLLEHPRILPHSCAILGRSLGGAIATQVASELETIKALALWCPVFDAKPWVQKYKGIPKDAQFSGQNLQEETIRQFAQLDTQKPLEVLSETPMLIAHAGHDEILGRYHYEQYLEHRKKCPNTETFELARSNHDFSNVHEQDILLEKTTNWLEKMLIDY